MSKKIIPYDCIECGSIEMVFLEKYLGAVVSGESAFFKITNHHIKNLWSMAIPPMEVYEGYHKAIDDGVKDQWSLGSKYGEDANTAWYLLKKIIDVMHEYDSPYEEFFFEAIDT